MYPETPRETASPDFDPATGELPEGFNRQPDWRQLKAGDRVVIRSPSHAPAAGTIDAAADDGSILWLLPDDGSTRKIYCRSDHEEIWAFAKAQ
ncbi:hypothetical protein GCM10012320_35880 [Sinomonas cellulolyticus]|uniref:Uncharacterized protein n=1 Tax=Sinomonas cellulolyticus TaxID=2801916 RepID=A0ABS1JYU4_9MICC|nr:MULTISPECIES: hypothetical protein [Sinomonas]MBL0704227.1 hypothetical protein [Sinomonas cellulolyticus]GHG61042.1 hypothetical protein GCM10012320_35880 [Sinomonas sp. KCTC 49339]